MRFLFKNIEGNISFLSSINITILSHFEFCLLSVTLCNGEMALQRGYKTIKVTLSIEITDKYEYLNLLITYTFPVFYQL